MKSYEINQSSSANSELLIVQSDETSLPDNDMMSRIVTTPELADF